MRRPSVCLLILLASGIVAASLSVADEEEPTTVEALRYRMVFAESGLDLSHGGGRWVEGLFLPEAKVAAMHVYDVEMRPGPPLEFVDRVRLFAYSSEKPQNDLTGLSGEPSPVERIEIPAGLAREIVALAELTAKQQAETVRLGGEVAKRLGWKEIRPDEQAR